VIENEFNGTEIACRPIELGQVFINLLNNSFDAISDLEEKVIWIKIHQIQNSIRISFIDSGKGIPQEIERRMFDPFFTTKPVGKGVGIGMSISKKIIEMHRGTIQVDRNSPFTKIDITIPINEI
jgi:signal transduction histidine kinase